MKNYDPNIYYGIHILRITLQQWNYKGHIMQKVYGNCKGRNVLDFDFECEDTFQDNDCQLEYHEDEDYFSYVLRDEEGNTLSGDEDARGMNDMIVAVEIIDYIKN